MGEPARGEERTRRSARRRTGILLAAAAFAVEALALAARGYRLGGEVPVRCHRGHLFTTIWLPGISLKSARLGMWRIQWCPVGRHVSVVMPVRRERLTGRERRLARRTRDIRVP